MKLSHTSAPHRRPTSAPTRTGDKRQRAAIEGYAKRAGFALVGEFNDAAVSGADPIETRPGFAALLDRIEGNGVRTVIVEDASRFARELVSQHQDAGGCDGRAGPGRLNRVSASIGGASAGVRLPCGVAAG